MRLASRVNNLAPSFALDLHYRYREMLRQGKDVVSFAVGEPDFDTPAHIKKAGIEAIEQGWGKLPDAVRPALRADKAQLDLRRANALLLERAGVPRAHVVCVGPCTHCAQHDYFSHRAAQGPTGRQLSFIGWRE